MNPDKKAKLEAINFRWRVRVVRGTRRKTKSILQEEQRRQQQMEEEEDDDDEEETEEEEDDDDDEEFHAPADNVVHRNEAGRIQSIDDRTTRFTPMANRVSLGPSSDLVSRSNLEYDMFGQRIPSPPEHTSSSQCDMCNDTIDKVSGKCGSCHSTFCAGCFDKIFQVHGETCPGCAGTVAATGDVIMI